MARRKEIFKDATIYSISSYGAQLLDIVNGILVRRFLGPANMGLWSFLQVIQSYAKHAGLGVTMATARDVPYYLGKGEPEKASEVKNLVFSFTVSTALLMALGVVAFAYFNRMHYSQPIILGLFVIAGLIVLQRLYNLFVVLLRAHKKFVFTSMLNIASSAMSLILTVTLVWKFGLYGLFVALILNYIMMIALIFAKTPYRFAFLFNLPKLMPLLSLGFAMVCSDILRTVLMSIDRIMIASFLGFESLGHYSIALMAGNYLYALPNILGIIFFPHFQEVFAQRDNKNDLAKFLREPTLCIAYLFPFIIGLIWMIAEWIVPIILPRYVPGIPALRIFILGSFFMALTHVFATYIITVRKHWLFIPFQGACVILGFTGAWLVIRLGWGIEGVAAMMALIFTLYFLVLSSFALRETHMPKEMTLLYLKIFGVFVGLVVALWGIQYLTRPLESGFSKFLMSYAGFAFLASPLAVLAEKETGVLSTMAGTVRNLLRKSPN